ncbi:MAG: cytochrome-c oxidase, cbb3-type subunit III, partial [Rhizobiaceae bacterium]
TGHEWDGIRELNNPMPRWWVLTFYACIVWALLYTIAYPAWPMLTSATKGWLGYSSRGEVRKELAAAEEQKIDYRKAIADKPLADIIADEKLRTFAIAAGGAAFKVNCIQCHGSGAQGSAGFPNLNDDDWLWGGKLDDIHTTLTHGIRYASDAKTRTSEMPKYGDILKPEEITQVATFVANLTTAQTDAAAVTAGKELYAQNCAACHGEDAKGGREFGSPNLADAVWLYGSSVEQIEAQIRAPKQGAMPGWGPRLGDVAIKELTVFVHSLGGGE